MGALVIPSLSLFSCRTALNGQATGCDAPPAAATGRILCGTTLQCQLIFLRRNYFCLMCNIKAGLRRMATRWRPFRSKIEHNNAHRMGLHKPQSSAQCFYGVKKVH
ncbi:hypothetical protein [Xanthobacter autotrophicus]|uniref:hypothetical protein n=1 Tax=Xanthobacter autotrophicus TaxID=280 RepID=UPI003729B754